ncbi:MAG TPA: trypsin-like peptidase domain-containing protein [Tepidisphaeraceae bacterium]|nr:trypsin-like peptidase domain-containing protein [Tepidisphaeraceae bacterium]
MTDRTRRPSRPALRRTVMAVTFALLAAVAAAAPAVGRAAEPSLAKDGPGTLPATVPATKQATTASATQTAVTGARATFPAATPEVVTAVTRKIYPAVVRIDVAQEAYAEGKRTLRRGIGSGVIIDAEGRILTNYHVAGRAAEIFVTLANKERVRAKLIGDDHWTDLAVIQMDLAEVKRKNFEFAYAELGSSSQLQPAENVMAVGTPHGFARTVTLGVVSNPNQVIDRELDIDGYETGVFSNWIQMDTPINPGNSGGPLVDMTGHVVGINTRGGGQNLNFAVPIDAAKQVVEGILKSATPEKKGRVERSDLGIDLKPLQDLESFYDIDPNKGVLINSVDRNSPAFKAGVKTQDILLELNGKPVNVRFPEELAPARRMIAELPVGTAVSMLLKRGKETVTLSAKTQKLESATGEESEFKTWGLSVRDVTVPYANANQLDDDTGVSVTTLSGGYPAAKAELQAGDVIRSVNGKNVADLDEFKKLYADSVKAKEPRVLLEFQRDRGRRRAVLRVENYAVVDAAVAATTNPAAASQRSAAP